jgi:hypothetical protein
VFSRKYEWFPPYNFYTTREKIYDENNLHKYFTMLYYSIMAFGKNDITPFTIGELAFVSFTMIICSFF